MSVFTEFERGPAIWYDAEASGILKKQYWRVVTGFRYYIGYLGSNQWVDVPNNKLTDGATIPFPIDIILPLWGEYAQAVILHDYLCDHYTITVSDGKILEEVRITRKQIDEILNEALIVLKVKTWRRLVIMFGINLFRWIKNPQGPIENDKKFELEKRPMSIIR